MVANLRASSANIKTALRTAQVAADDGTAAFPRFREEQLARLYGAASSEREAIASAIRADFGRTQAEAQTELTIVLEHVKAQFDQTKYSQVNAAQKTGYAQGVTQRGIGLVVVVGDARAALLSVIAPLASAIASGNAVVSVLAPGASTLNKLLLDCLATLDRQCFVFVDPADTKGDVIQEVRGYTPALIVDASCSSGSNTVVVDKHRSAAELALIAKLIVRGKWFGLGQLPGSIDQLFVHEEASGQLLELILEEVRQSFGSDPARSDDYGRLAQASFGAELDQTVQRETSESGKIIAGGSFTKPSFFPPTIIENASSGLFSKAGSGPILPVRSFRSFEGVLAAMEQTKTSNLYVFALEQDCKFLVAESAASTVYTGDIPLAALCEFSIAATTQASLPDTSSQHSVCHRIKDLPNPEIYAPSRFTRPVRIFTPTTLASSKLAKLIAFAPFTSAKLLALAQASPSEKRLVVKRVQPGNSFLRAFFPQGLLITAGFVVSVLLSATGFVGYHGVRRISRKYFA
ncbi:BQ5605_C001g00533 [Microbotryum silenes-dioicae]|uniref:BQ5605_C001g00533 protein n=1 Tax=Microbotryum silenes-dioicae TaxID=796604 RepID=A0A2X0M3M3_9BASI|nr:BQ5605_C001g00533 [Microbotryum silenes-dioicae]